MHHQAYVGLVDAHAEGGGSHHDTGLVGLPAVLVHGLLLRREAGVVEVGGDSCCGERLGNLARTLARAHVDYSRAGHTAGNVDELFLLQVAAAHYIVEVRAVERETEHACVGPEIKLAADVLHHLGRGRGRERKHRDIGELFAEFAYFQVGGTEIVAPLRYAVGLVDHYEAYRQA